MAQIYGKYNTFQTTLFAQQLAANASGFALNENPMLMIYPIASDRDVLDANLGLVFISA